MIIVQILLPLTRLAFTPEGRKVGIYVLPGFEYQQVALMKTAFEAAGMMAKVVGPSSGAVKSAGGVSLTAEFTFENSRSTHFDAIIFIGGSGAEYPKKLKIGRLIHAVREAYMHLKTIGATGNAVSFVTDVCLPGEFSPAVKEEGIVLEKGVLLASSVGTGAEFTQKFMAGVAKHRVWDRDVEHIAA